MSKQILDSLIKLHYEKVFKILYLIFQDKTIAEDACQEAFYEASKNLDSIKDISKFHSWVLTIAIRKAFQMIKKKDNIVLTNRIEDEKDFSVNVEQQALTKEMQSEIQQLIKELDFIYRQVVVLRYYYDMEDKEIAMILDIPVGTVKSRLHRAKVILREKIMANTKQGVR